MTKRQLIDEIRTINRSAEPEFLAKFQDEDLTDYLEHLHVALSPRPCAPSGRPGRRFRSARSRPVEAADWLESPEHEYDEAQTELAHEPSDDELLLYETDTRRPGNAPAPEPQDDAGAAKAPDPSDGAPQGAAVGARQADDNKTPFAQEDEDSESWLF